jgi:CRP-like cAMP-binding protein
MNSVPNQPVPRAGQDEVGPSTERLRNLNHYFSPFYRRKPDFIMAIINLDPFKGCFLFKDMTESELGVLAGLFSEKSFQEGMTVFIEKMPGESLYLILEGTIRISKMLAEGEEKTLVILGPDDVFGEMAILDGAPRSATARVIESARLFSIRKNDFEALCEQTPKLGLKLMRNIVRVFSQRIRENREDYREMLLWSLGSKT